jgi:hypothetical protein
MQKTIFTLLIALGLFSANAQVEPANVYPSNLEENMYFDRYDESSTTITGLYFLVLSDGNNSKSKTPAFEVSIYLMPEGKNSREDLIIVKTYPLDGIFHFGKHEFKNESINLAGKDVAPGNYRVGIWVNSNAAFEENTNDNATLFRNSIKITENPRGKSTGIQKKKFKWDDDEDDDWDDEDDDDDDWDEDDF